MGKRSKSETSAMDAESPPSKKKSAAPVEEEDGDETAVAGVTAGGTGAGTGAAAGVPSASLSYSEKLAFASPIASPIAGKKLTKKLLKLIRKSCKVKNHFRSGLRDVQTRIRKGETGICIFASDVTPIDVMCHLPAVCEERDIPYVFVPMRSDISDAMSVRRPTTMALVVAVNPPDPAFHEYKDLYDECLQGIKELN